MKISINQYAQALLELTEHKTQQEIPTIIEKFALQLKKDGQLKNSKKIGDAFEKAYNTAHGIVKATIVTRQLATNLSVEEIEGYIKKKYNATQVEIEMLVDESIGGGIVIRVGDEVMDGSVSGKLKRLEKQLME